IHRPMSESRQFQRSHQRHSAYPSLPGVTSSHIWMLRPKATPILLRRPSVQTTCSGQCSCTVVCTLVRLGKGTQRLDSWRCPARTGRAPGSARAQSFSPQVLHDVLVRPLHFGRAPDLPPDRGDALAGKTALGGLTLVQGKQRCSAAE
uniref:Uncharacterized protein n=1 Tax=Varanus komodoensis TaxID=61221 RepID=A0A8D2LDD9_VARKO